MAQLTLHGVSKSYGELRALDTVSIAFTPGTVTAIIGPSGCGKSTLLRLCNGLETPDSGHVEVFGEAMDYTALPALRRRIGYAVQGNGLFPHLSAGDNIRLLARLEGWDDARIDERVEQLRGLVNLPEEALMRYPHQLSGGQQQRVGICRAMMLRPEMLLLDEPFAAIDPLTRHDIHRQLLALQAAEPRTAILVTHDMREALLLAQHIVVMRAGCVVSSEPRDALLARAGDRDPEDLLYDLLGESTA